MNLSVNVDVKKLYKKLCPECKKVLEEMVQDDLAKQYAGQLTKQVLEGKDKS